MEVWVTKPGHLVTIKPGNYLTDITGRDNVAMLLLKNPTLGIVLEGETNGLNLVQVQDDRHCRIYARTSVLNNAELEKSDDE